jgi:hypothetical protein
LLSQRCKTMDRLSVYSKLWWAQTDRLSVCSCWMGLYLSRLALDKVRDQLSQLGRALYSLALGR